MEPSYSAWKSDTFARFFSGFSDKSQPNTPIDFKRQFCAVGTSLRLLLRVQAISVSRWHPSRHHDTPSTWATRRARGTAQVASWVSRVTVHAVLNMHG